MPSVEFQEFVSNTGDTTKRALFRIHADNGPWMFSVVSGINRSAKTVLLASRSVTEQDFDAAHIDYARHAIEARLPSEPGWAESSQGDDGVVMDLGTSDIDRVAFGELLDRSTDS